MAGCLCTKGRKKNKFIKIIYPGGNVELLYRPIVAAEIMRRNPKCYVTHPTVFHEPWAVVASEFVLVLGQRYYVVPSSTLRKLQRKSPRSPYSPRGELDDASFSGSSKSSSSSIKRGVNKLEDGCFKFLHAKSNSKAGDKDGMENYAAKDISSSPKRMTNTPSYNWQPRLESITEE